MPDSTHPTGFWLPTETWFRTATRAASIGVWEWDLATGAMRFSSVARAIFGFSPDEELTIAKVGTTTHPDDHPWTAQRTLLAIDPERRERSEFDYRIRRNDTGETRWLHARGEAIFGVVDGEVRAVRYLGTVQDITEGRQVAQRLAASEARLRLAIEAAGLAVWEIDAGAGTISNSPELNRLFGLPEDAVPTLDDIRALYAPGERERFETEAAAALAQGEGKFQTEVEFVGRDGRPLWLLLRAQAVAGSEGQRAIGVMMDVTQRKLQEARLEAVAGEMHHRLRNLIAISGAIATQSWRGADDAEAALAAFRGRMKALSTATDMTLRPGQAGGDLGTLVASIIEPFGGTGRVALAGERVAVPPGAVQGLALALHELATNAVKYGALAVPEGRVEIGWRHADGALELDWRERGGAAAVTAREGGYGSRLLAGLFAAPDSLTLELGPGGVECGIRIADAG